MPQNIAITLEFTGAQSDKQLIDFYDVSHALIGFQRSLAITTHFALNGRVISHAPALKGAAIYALPPEQGSWKITAIVGSIMAGAYGLGTADKNTPIGHLVFSLYDYVISESLGVPLDYDKTVQQLRRDGLAKSRDDNDVGQEDLDELIQRCAPAIKDMHHPIHRSETAKKGLVYASVNDKPIYAATPLTKSTYDFIRETRRATRTEKFVGRITSYNSRTYRGRVNVATLGRGVPFELAEGARDMGTVRLITTSLRANALKDAQSKMLSIRFVAYRNLSAAGHLKGFTIVAVEPDV